MKKLLVALFLTVGFGMPVLCQSWMWTDIAYVNNPYSPVDAMITDNLGNVYVTGKYHFDISFGSFTFTSVIPCNNHQNTYIAKYNATGSLLWAKQLAVLYDVNSGCIPNALTFDKAGHILMVGYYTDTVSIGANMFDGYVGFYANQNCFIAKFDTAGNLIWVKGPSSHYVGSANCTSIVTDTFGYFYITGNFFDTLYFGSYMMACKGFGGIFLAKYDSGGNFIWAKQAYSPDTISGWSNSITYSIKDNGSIYIAGTSGTSTIFGSDTVTAPLINDYSYSNNIFLARYDLNGNLIWVKQSRVPSSSSYGYNPFLAIDNEGNPYITGFMIDTLDFDTNTLINKMPNYSYMGCTFLVKYDTNGNVTWAKNFTGTRGWSQGTTLFHDKYDYLYIGGLGGGDSIDFSYFRYGVPAADTAVGVAFLLKINTSGDVLCGSGIPNRDCMIGACDSGGNYIYAASNMYQGQGNLTVARWIPCSVNLGIPQKEEDNKWVVYPNPSKGKVIIDESVIDGRQFSVNIYNMLGERVFTKGSIQGINSIDLSNYPDGVYLYRIITESGNVAGEGKIVIEK